MHVVFLLAAPLALVACSGDIPQPSSPDTGENGATPQGTPAPATLPTSVPTNPISTDRKARPRPGAIKTFGDWTVGCDNVGLCKAVSLGDASGGDFRELGVTIERAMGNAMPVLRVTAPDEITAPATITVDGKRVARGGDTADGAAIFTGDAALRATMALVAGRSASLTASGRTVPLSLAGVSASLRYVDAEQMRGYSPTALVARGTASPGTATATPLPIIRAIAPGGTPAEPSPETIAGLYARARCTIADYVDPAPEAESHALGDGTTLLLLPCDAGAYNMMTAVFVGTGGRFEPARFDVDVGMNPEETPVPQLVNAGFGDGVLATFSKGRGLADCGIAQQFVWDGDRFRLSEEMQMGECRGSREMITTWRAHVVR